MVDADPNQYLLYTDIEDFDYFCGTLSHEQGGADASTSATSCSRTGRTSSTSSTRPTSATTWCGSRATRCPTRRSSTRCTSTCRSATATARWSARRTTSSARRSRRGAATSASRTSLRRRSSCASASSSRTSASWTCSSRRATTCKQRYVDWGIPATKIVVEGLSGPRRATGVPTSRRAGRATASPSSASSTPTRAPTCCCEAMDILGEDFDGHLWIYGANLDKQSPELARAVRGAARRRPRTPSRSPAPTSTTELGKLMARDRLGGGALDLVGDRAARGLGGVPARPAGDLQRHRRHVREGHRRRQRPALPHAATPRTWRR